MNCKLWFCLASNASMTEKGSDEVLCSACKRLRSYLEWQQKKLYNQSGCSTSSILSTMLHIKCALLE